MPDAFARRLRETPMLIRDLALALCDDPADDACRLALADACEEAAGTYDPEAHPLACTAAVLRSGRTVRIEQVGDTAYWVGPDGSFAALLCGAAGVRPLYPRLLWDGAWRDSPVE